MIRLYYIFKLILRGLRLRPWGSLLTLIACWFALCELSLLLYAVDIADRASVMPATSGSMIAYHCGLLVKFPMSSSYRDSSAWRE